MRRSHSSVSSHVPIRSVSPWPFAAVLAPVALVYFGGRVMPASSLEPCGAARRAQLGVAGNK